ncbi:ATP-dependent DNA ligase [Mangrovactinospora gilvigrisea]|uniref:ATP-dependent DNA ligase n=1 Tax=Mangrovactinospora gilvigrisea TaxID=1428644 RepID=A0A1J7BKZ7_9ACTN|nr:ATP-dependent DNA ligase [Mangrovactinospora gilvigrisea]OIV39359.1 ATP-dependent DNA ligase [Mangrovactinospora gilvigrisea]
MPLDPPLEPMLAADRGELPADGALAGGLRFEQKVDGFRAILFARPGRVLLHSRQGKDLTEAFPDLAAAAARLREPVVLDGELVVYHDGRLDFAQLQQRARRSARTATRAAAAHPAALICFDVLEHAGTPLLARPYHERRTLLEDLFARRILTPPFTLCPATADRELAREWLDPAWGAVGIEGVVAKGAEQPYRPGARGWLKIRSRSSAEALIAGTTGSRSAPASLLVARYDDTGRLRLVARTTPLPPAARRDLGARLTPAGAEHPWHGRHFSAGWGGRGELEVDLVRPELVAEFLADTANDAGRYRHPVRFQRLREDQLPDQVARFDS